MKNYLIPLFKKYFYLSIVLTVFMASCNEDKILEEKPLDFLSPGNAYDNVSGIKQGITDLYVDVRDNWTTPDGKRVVWNGAGTDVSMSGDPGNVYYLADYTVGLNSQAQLVSDFWNPLYRLIQKTNVLISSIEESDPGIWSSEEQMNAYLGEVKFFRAFAYRILVVMFGDVPLVTEVVNSAKVDFVRSPKEDIWQLIEDDLKFATINLPDRGKEENPGRIAKGAAWHYLSEAYLNQSKFQLSVDAASEIIDGSDYALMTKRFGSTVNVFGTGDVCLDLFAYGNQLRNENKEALFIIQYEPNVEGGSQYPGSRSWCGAYYALGNAPDGFKAILGTKYQGNYTGLIDTLGRGAAFIRPTWFASHTIWRSDWNNDIRNAKHAIFRDYRYDNPASAYNKQIIDFSKYPAGARNSERDTMLLLYPFFTNFSMGLFIK